MSNLAFRLAEIERRLANLARVGTVAAVDPSAARVKVALGTMLTGWIPWLAGAANGAKKTWEPPTVGEQVMVISPSGELAQGVAIPAVYQAAFGAPASVPTVDRTTYVDGTVVEYDLATHTLKAAVIGKAEISATLEVKASSPVKITLQAPVVDVQGVLQQSGGNQTLTGNMTLVGNISIQGALDVDGVATVTGDVLANGISLSTHRHGGVTSGGAQTAIPNP